MDGPSGLNQPRRKSRLRGRDAATAAPLSPAAPPPLRSESQEEPTASPGYDADFEPAASGSTSPMEGVAQDVTEAPPSSERPASYPTLAEDEEHPAAFRLNKVYTEASPRSPFKDWRWWLFFVALGGVGTFIGYGLGARNAAPQGISPRNRYLQAKNALIGGIDPKAEAEVDAAFESSKLGRYAEARERFSALSDKHPEWPSMAIEVSRAYLYLRDSQEAQRSLTPLSADHVTPDADFMLALLHLTNKEFDLAENSFAIAVGQDPARPDYYYFWGECLRRDGKPKEAIARFRSALLRNQYENAEGLYQLKLWLSEIQADQAEASGSNKKIDEVLASSHPSYEALFAAAGRSIKARRFDEAARFIAKAQAITEPAVFRVILQDPTYLEESTRPELAGFYKF